MSERPLSQRASPASSASAQLASRLSDGAQQLEPKPLPSPQLADFASFFDIQPPNEALVSFPVEGTPSLYQTLMAGDGVVAQALRASSPSEYSEGAIDLKSDLAPAELAAAQRQGKQAPSQMGDAAAAAAAAQQQLFFSSFSQPEKSAFDSNSAGALASPLLSFPMSAKQTDSAVTMAGALAPTADGWPASQWPRAGRKRPAPAEDAAKSRAAPAEAAIPEAQMVASGEPIHAPRGRGRGAASHAAAGPSSRRLVAHRQQSRGDGGEAAAAAAAAAARAAARAAAEDEAEDEEEEEEKEDADGGEEESGSAGRAQKRLRTRRRAEEAASAKSEDEHHGSSQLGSDESSSGPRSRKEKQKGYDESRRRRMKDAFDDLERLLGQLTAAAGRGGRPPKGRRQIVLVAIQQLERLKQLLQQQRAAVAAASVAPSTEAAALVAFGTRGAGAGANGSSGANAATAPSSIAATALAMEQSHDLSLIERLFADSGLAFCVVAVQARVIRCNRAHLALYGAAAPRPHELRSTSSLRITGVEDLGQTVAVIERLLHCNASNLDFRTTLPMASGQRVDVEGHSWCVRDPAGNPQYVVCMSRPVRRS
jgi:PAS domain-containing protein